MAISKDAQRTIVDIDNMIDRAYAPKNMSPEEAIEFLEEIASSVEGKIDALKAENDIQ